MRSADTEGFGLFGACPSRNNCASVVAPREHSQPHGEIRLSLARPGLPAFWILPLLRRTLLSSNLAGRERLATRFSRLRPERKAKRRRRIFYEQLLFLCGKKFLQGHQRKSFKKAIAPNCFSPPFFTFFSLNSFYFLVNICGNSRSFGFIPESPKTVYDI